MFLHKSGHSKKGGGIAGIFRLFLSLIIMAVLGLGLYQAYRSFSGVDPLTLDPKSFAKNFLTSEGVYNLVTGLLTVSPGASIDKAKTLLKDGPDAATTTPSAPLSFKFALIADSHNDNANLKKALDQAKQAGAKYVIGLGDYTDVGTPEELQNAKTQFDASGLPYYLTSGDHDLWDARNKKLNASDEFTQVFGPSYQAFSYQNVRNILIFNSDDYLGLDGVELKWVEDELSTASTDGKLTFVYTHTPLFHPSSDHQMGRINEKLKNQSDHLISLISKSGAKEVFSGDTHVYSSYKEPTTQLKMSTIGAVTSIRNPQAPRFAIVNVYEDGTYSVEDTEIH